MSIVLFKEGRKESGRALGRRILRSMVARMKINKVESSSRERVNRELRKGRRGRREGLFGR